MDMPTVQNVEHADLANLYEHYAARIRTFITRIASDCEAADLCQDAFLSALGGWHRRREQLIARGRARLRGQAA